MTQELWLEAHSYLRPLADLSAQVDRAADGIEVLDARIPDWDDYRTDFLAGVPLLRAERCGFDRAAEWRELSNDWLRRRRMARPRPGA